MLQPPTILFLSDTSNRSWPSALAEVFPGYQIATQLESADPANTIAALVWKHPYGALRHFNRLRLIVNLGAGVDHIVGDPDLPAGVPIVRLVDPGLTDRMSEYVLMHCLSLHRKLPEARIAQSECRWNFMAPTPPDTTCVGILGFGKLARACADLLSRIGFRVVGWKRSPATFGSFDVFDGREGLPLFLSKADIVVSLLPSTGLTRNLLDSSFFHAMRAGAALINVGRGDLLVEEDLLASLDSGHIRHAVLDVFRTEPLPIGHRFWSHPNITVTPHNSSATDPSTALQQVVENIRRALSNDDLLNRVDAEAGY
ncbi:glyoxylate/hydroxypyruvate reductase A [Metarhizobium album]|uniref:Glyoxylate/hydroxypyruvate reductase A n=1 Tax=Metarhizobium album TaxID=2182425 RepID=A0A2U2DK73_9HYPH|nr:glyoxylate/hydroxypyruvate reductase A [Rhizobium album]PWE53716.1 glyoxylate/hydroxypyruvate reductase A [Rhizobium album]